MTCLKVENILCWRMFAAFAGQRWLPGYVPCIMSYTYVKLADKLDHEHSRNF